MRTHLLFFTLALLSIGKAFAQVESFQTGEVLSHDLSICGTKEAAIAVVNADVVGGLPAAQKTYNERDECATLPVVGPQVGRVVHSVKVKRGDKQKTASVVEIVNSEGKVLAWFITTAPVLAKLAVLPERNS
jgi:hypothetical protein